MHNILLIDKLIGFPFALIKALAMNANNAQNTAISPKLIRSQQSPSTYQHTPDAQMTNDASHHHVHLPRHQPDVNEHKEKDDRTTSTAVFRSSTNTLDETDHIQNDNEKKNSMPQTTTTTKDAKLLVAEEMPTLSSLSSNQIIPTTDVQSDNNEISSLNPNISSYATITTFHSISPDASSSTRRFIPSSADQQSNAYENDESLLPVVPSITTSSSLLMHEQTRYDDEKYSENQSQMNKDISIDNNQILTGSEVNKVEENQSLLLFYI